MNLQLKFKESTPVAKRDRLIDELKKRPNVEDIRPLFPGSDDRELAALYVVQLPDSSENQVVKYLNSRSSVEFVEPEAERGLPAH